MEEGSIVFRQPASGIAERAATRRRKANRTTGDSRPWAELPEEILELILLSLGAIDFLMFSRVCHAWRNLAATHRARVMNAQSPYLVLLSTHAKKACYFFNTFENKLWKTILPNLTGKICFGTTCGFLIMLDKDHSLTRIAWKTSEMWLLNPFTGRQLRFPPATEPYCGILLGRFRPTGEYILVTYSRLFQHVQYFTASSRQWLTYDFSHKNNWLILDLIYFRGQIYFLSSFCELGRLRLFCSDGNPFQILSKNELPVNPNYFVHLATTSEDILMVNFKAPRNIEIHKYNFDQQDWVRANLTEEAVYMCDRKSTGVHLKNRVPDCPDGQDFIYCVTPSRNLSAACYVGGRFRKHLPVTRDDGQPSVPLDVPLWYFPYLAYDVQVYDGLEGA